MPIDQQSLITTVTLIGAPLIGMLLSMATLFNMGTKELEELFSDIGTYVKKRKAENIIRLMFPEKLGIEKEKGDIEVDNDSIKTLASEIDRVAELGFLLSRCRYYVKKYHTSLLVILITGVCFLLLKSLGFHLLFLNIYLKLVDVVVVVWVFGGFAFLWSKKQELNDSYEKEYDV